MSKKPKKGASKPSTSQSENVVPAKVTSDVVKAEPSPETPRANKLKAKPAPQSKGTKSKSNTSKLKDQASSASDAAPDAPNPRTGGAKQQPKRAPKDAAAKKTADADTDTAPKELASKDAASKRKANKASRQTLEKGTKAAGRDELEGAKKSGAKNVAAASSKKGALKSAPLKAAEQAKPKTTREKVASKTDRRAELIEESVELSFANSPFADLPHASGADVSDADVVEEQPASKRSEKAKKKTVASDEAAPNVKTKRGKKTPAKAEVEGDTTAARGGADAQNSTETTDDPGQSGEEASGLSDETLIDPAGLAPEGEPAGDEEEGDEAGLFTTELQADDEEREVLSEEEENRRYLKGILEALLFSSDKPLSGRELARAARIDKKRTLQLLVELRKEYRYRGVNIAEISGGFVLRSNPSYGAYVQKALALRPVRLSRAQLETLAIIAYRQPITRPEIDDIRGVDSGQVLKGLADRDLIKMLGKKDEAGRPMLYGTTEAFLELFSLESLKGLPSLREFTELSDDSREKFAEVTGEAMPSGESVGESEETADTAALESESTEGALQDEVGETEAVTPQPDDEDPEALRAQASPMEEVATPEADPDSDPSHDAFDDESPEVDFEPAASDAESNEPDPEDDDASVF